MTSVPEAKATPEEDEKENQQKVKEKPKRGKGKGAASVDSAEADVEPKMKKKRAKAIEIDKTQSKRIVKPKRRVRPRRVVKAVKAVMAVQKARDIGVEVSPPQEPCQDPFCPFHGTLSVRGQILNGVVVASKMDKTAVIQREVKRYIPKFERYEKRTHNYHVHNPPCLNVQRGDVVRIMECRPLSKTKSFVVIEKL